jgi:2-hydroxychromene-2-carboxylate isomerase
MTEVIFLYDFGSPNAYLAHRVLPAVAARTGAVFRYQPVLLGGLFKATNNRAPLVAFADIPSKTAYIHREIARFVRRHAISAFAMNPHFPVNTLLAMRGAVAAGRLGLGEAYVEALMAAMWEQGLKLDDPAVLGGALAAAGLPAEQLFALAQDQSVKDELAAHTQAAAERGAFGIPSFLHGAELYFGKDGLFELETDLARAGAQR